MIDYSIVNEETWEEIESMVIERRIESDHQPLSVKVRGEEREKVWKEEEKRERQVWGIKEKEEFKKKSEEISWREEGIENGRRELTEKIRSITKWERKKKPWTIGQNEWWDMECRRKKKKLQRTWREVGRREESEEREWQNFKEERRRYREMCREKKEKWREKEDKRIEEMKEEGEMWRYINRERKKRTGISDKIKIEQWTKHFIELLGGKEERSRVEMESRTEEEQKNRRK